MSIRCSTLALAAALGLGLATSARAADDKAAEAPAANGNAADLNKYLPESTAVYVHVNVNRFLTAPVVRRVTPFPLTLAACNISHHDSIGHACTWCASQNLCSNTSSCTCEYYPQAECKASAHGSCDWCPNQNLCTKSDATAAG